MTDETKYRTPGQLIQELLELRGWTQRVLAIVMNTDETIISKIITGTRPIDASEALAFSELFGVPAERFMELQKSYDLAQARLVSRPDQGRTNRAHLFGKLPVADMIRRGWVHAEDIRDVPKVESALARFFGAESPDQIEILPNAAKKTNVHGEATPAQIAWLYRVKQIASEMLVPRYSPSAVESAVEKLKAFRATISELRKIPRILADGGIRYLIVESIPGAKIDGVCLWLNNTSPVIAMSLRYDRIDNFWFVLRHELEHVLRLHGQTAIMLDAELEGHRAGVGADIPEQERVANEAAAEFSVPRKSMEQFVARKAPIYAERDIIGFARTLRVHPGLVAGQLHRITERYERFRNHLAKVRSVIAPSAVVDGWGDTVPVGEE